MSDDSSRDVDEVIGFDEDRNPITRRLIRNMLKCGLEGTATYFVHLYCPGFTLDDV